VCRDWRGEEQGKGGEKVKRIRQSSKWKPSRGTLGKWISGDSWGKENGEGNEEKKGAGGWVGLGNEGPLKGVERNQPLLQKAKCNV